MSVDVVDVVMVILGIVPILEEILETSRMLSWFYEPLLRIIADSPEWALELTQFKKYIHTPPHKAHVYINIYTHT